MEEPDKKKQRKQMQLISELEQMSAPLREVAKIIAGYHHNLVINGLTREEALDLVRDYQDGLLVQIFGPAQRFLDDEDED